MNHLVKIVESLHLLNIQMHLCVGKHFVLYVYTLTESDSVSGYSILDKPNSSNQAHKVIAMLWNVSMHVPLLIEEINLVSNLEIAMSELSYSFRHFELYKTSSCLLASHHSEYS